MVRKIVLTRGHEWLRAGWNERSFAPAGTRLRSEIKTRGMEFDETYHPVRVPGESALKLSRPPAVGFNYRAMSDISRRAAYSVRAVFDDEEAVERLKADRADEIIGVYADLMIAPCPTYCGRSAVGTSKQVSSVMGVRALRRAGLTGRNVRVAIVDTGVDGSKVKVAGGWGPVLGYEPGTTEAVFNSGAAHGTMCAFDVLIAAPDARIFDYALLQSEGPGWSAFLSDAITAFGHLIEMLDRQPGPLVVNNSWALFNRENDEPIGSPGNYSANPDHPFNQMVGTLVGAGADVCFAAGNCGAQCPDGRCGINDKGPGASIHGANSHPDVLTVAAVTVDKRRLGYSSQGPGGLHKRKPDLAGYSHFAGSGVYEADGGTSAASPVVAGVVAALRQKVSVKRRSPASMKALLQRSAKDVGGDLWDFDLGYGVVDAAAAVKTLKLTATKKVAAKAGKKGSKKSSKKKAASPKKTS